MKRLTIVALCLALALAVPAMALDADFSGEFRVRGFSHDNINLSDPAGASSAFYDTRTRVKAIFKVSDNISFTTQFDALERVWGTTQNYTVSGTTVAKSSYDDNINFEHAYATIKTPVGGLLVGRLIGSQWGPSGLGDSNDVGKDRILLFVPVENWTFVAYTEKASEQDVGTTTSDEDLDKYTVAVKYKGESFEGGFLLTNYKYKDFYAMRDLMALRTAGAPAATASKVDADAYIALPYVTADFGPFSAFAEGLFGTGSGDVKATGRNDMDVDVAAYHVEGKYNFGPGYLRGGYFFQSGDNNTGDDELNAVGYLEQSQDLDIAFILNGTGEYANAGLADSLGGLGNFSGNAQTTSGRLGTTAMAGAKMIYASVGFSPMETLDLEFLYANAKVDAPPGTDYYIIGGGGAKYTTSWSDDVGDEYDFKVTWTPMENLEYKFVAAWLNAGDYWKMGNTAAKIDDNLTLFNSLTVSF